MLWVLLLSVLIGAAKGEGREERSEGGETPELSRWALGNYLRIKHCEDTLMHATNKGEKNENREKIGT